MTVSGIMPGSAAGGWPGRTGSSADAQYAGLAAGFEELPHVGAVAIDLVLAEEIEDDPVRERLRGDVDHQVSLGAEPQV